MKHHVYFAPGMFGFAQLGAFDYFAHVERALEGRFAAAGPGWPITSMCSATFAMIISGAPRTSTTIG